MADRNAVAGANAWANLTATRPVEEMSMHDQRALLENRLERFVRDHLKPAVYREGCAGDGDRLGRTG